MQGRMWAGRRHTARRGALLHPPPRGSVRGPDGDDQRDPEAQAQRVVRLLCDVCEPQGSRPGVLRSLVAHDMRLPMRPQAGLHRGQRVWRRPTRMPFHHLRPHPISAGAYGWGPRTSDPRPPQPGRRRPGRPLNAPEACDVLIADRWPASSSGGRLAAIPQR